MTQARNQAGAPVAIAIHGGSGTINKGDFSAGKEREIRETLERATRAAADLAAFQARIDDEQKIVDYGVVKEDEPAP